MRAQSATDGSAQTGVFAAVAAPQPTQAPTVNVPPGATTIPVTVTGNCQADTLVKVFKNAVFAGATFCNSGSYSIPIGLFYGSNSITAASYNTNDQSGPLSTAAIINYAPPGVTLPPISAPTFLGSSLPQNQPVLLTNQFYRGFQVGENVSWPIETRGGDAPYALSVSWGDGNTDLKSLPSSGKITLDHVYKSPGGAHNSYDVVVKLTDAKGRTAYLQFVIVIGGTAPTATKTGLPIGLSLAWPLVVAALLAVISFWLGEVREKRILGKVPAAAPRPIPAPALTNTVGP